VKIQFSKIERVAGLFVIVAISGFLFFSILLAYKQGWFSPSHTYQTSFAQGEGLHPGTTVQIAGLRAGSVTFVKLDDDNRINVTLSISHEFKSRIRQDSLARVIRPFIIGDKVVEITVGSKKLTEVKENSVILSEDTLDIMDMLGGGKLGSYLKEVSKLVENLEVLIQAFSDPKRTRALIGMFDELLPTLKDVRELSQQMTTHKNLKTSMQNIAVLTKEMNDVMPQTLKTMEQLAKVTEELNKILPSVAAVAPQLPEASQKSVEALKEAVTVLKAMQKSFLLRGAVKDVQEEEALAIKKKDDEKINREPSNKP
jgi:phospholipid/cholesterol/gamma-HCH transport system substrate-binding protein